MDPLGELRKQINAVDESLIQLLGTRYEICRSVGQYKQQHAIPMMQTTRIEEMRELHGRSALAHNVDPQFVRRLFELIVDEACRLEDEIIGGTARSAAGEGT